VREVHGVSELARTRDRLKAWGRWASGGIRGYPKMAAFMRALTGRGVSRALEPAPDILRVDELVLAAEPDTRKVLIRHYCGHSSGRQIAERLGISKSIYYSRLSDAIWYIHTSWDEPLIAMPDKTRYGCESVGFISTLTPK
jgi:hypothetical protein